LAIFEVDEFDIDEVLETEFSKNNIVILKFSSVYCDACMALDFELEELLEKLKNISILEIDCNTSEELTSRYDIVEVPTMMIYKDQNSLIYTGVGVRLAPDIESIILESVK